MTDVMVTARMRPEKKERGNQVLEALGTNASQVINRLYDYVIEFQKLPFPDDRHQRSALTPDAVAAARARIVELKVPNVVAPPPAVREEDRSAYDRPLRDDGGVERTFEEEDFEPEGVCFGKGWR